MNVFWLAGSVGDDNNRRKWQVKKARHNSDWRRDYMDWEMTMRNQLEKGRELERANTEEQRKRADAAEEEIRKLKEEINQLKKNKAE